MGRRACCAAGVVALDVDVARPAAEADAEVVGGADVEEVGGGEADVEGAVP